MMATRLKRYIHRCAAHIDSTRCRITQCRNFRMCLTRRLRMTLSYHDTLFNDHATNPRIWAGDEKTQLRLL
jgi:hypothetical protein